jgi:hypothetical protein
MLIIGHILRIPQASIVAAIASYLVLGVLRNDIQGSDCEAELARVRQLPHASAQGNQLVPCNIGCLLHQSFPDIEDPVFLKPEAMWLIWPVYQELYVLHMDIR